MEKEHKVFVSYIGKMTEAFDQFLEVAKQDIKTHFVHHFTEENPKITIHRNFDVNILIDKHTVEHIKLTIDTHKFPYLMTFDEETVQHLFGN